MGQTIYDDDDIDFGKEATQSKKIKSAIEKSIYQ